MKKYFYGVLTGFVVCAMLISTVAIANSPIKLIVNGQEVQSDVPPQVIGGRTMIPARPLAEALGATVAWDADENAVVVTGSVQAGDLNNIEENKTVGNVVDENGGNRMEHVNVNGVLANNQPYVVSYNEELYSYARTARDFILAQNNSISVRFDVSTNTLVVNNEKITAVPVSNGLTLIPLNLLKENGFLDYTWDKTNNNLLVPGI